MQVTFLLLARTILINIVTLCYYCAISRSTHRHGGASGNQTPSGSHDRHTLVPSCFCNHLANLNCVAFTRGILPGLNKPIGRLGQRSASLMQVRCLVQRPVVLYMSKSPYPVPEEARPLRPSASDMISTYILVRPFIPRVQVSRSGTVLWKHYGNEDSPDRRRKLGSTIRVPWV